MSRKNERPSYRNEFSTDYITKNSSKLIGVQSNVLNHILELVSLATIHIIALDARKSDTKLNKLKIEVPYFGCINVEVSGNDVIVKGFTMEDEFKRDLINAVKTGDSEFSKRIDERLVSKLKEKYNEYL